MENNDFGYVLWGGIDSFFYTDKNNIWLFSGKYDKSVVFKCLYNAVNFCIANGFSLYVYDTNGQFYGLFSHELRKFSMIKPINEPPICQ